MMDIAAVQWSNKKRHVTYQLLRYFQVALRISAATFFTEQKYMCFIPLSITFVIKIYLFHSCKNFYEGCIQFNFTHLNMPWFNTPLIFYVHTNIKHSLAVKVNKLLNSG